MGMACEGGMGATRGALGAVLAKRVGGGSQRGLVSAWERSASATL